MAQTELEEGSNPDAKKLAQAIIDAQEAEIAEMNTSAVSRTALPAAQRGTLDQLEPGSTDAGPSRDAAASSGIAVARRSHAPSPEVVSIELDLAADAGLQRYTRSLGGTPHEPHLSSTSRSRRYDGGPAPITTHPNRHLVSWSTWCSVAAALAAQSALRRPEIGTSWGRSGRHDLARPSYEASSAR